MGGLITCICCYCCLKTLNPRYIEICALICNIIEIIFLIWIIADIPWEDISSSGKAIFILSSAFIVLTFIILIVLMILRCGNKINTSLNGLGKCLCISMIVFDILAEILIIIAEIIILHNMDDKDDNSSYYDLNKGRRHEKYSHREWAAASVSPTIIEIFLGLHCYCSNFLLKLIYIKTNLSYSKYMNSKNNSNNIVSNTIQVFTPQINNINSNQLVFIGYDKYGHPIYSVKK